MTSLDDVYCKFGEAMEAAQLLETGIANILLVIGIVDANLIEQQDPAAAAALFKAMDRHTLGQLLGRLHKSVDSAKVIEVLLTGALKERNRLSHSFYREHNFRKNSAEGRSVMLRDLESIHDVLLDALQAVSLLSGVDLNSATLDESTPTTHHPI